MVWAVFQVPTLKPGSADVVPKEINRIKIEKKIFCMA
jgi:hypothetical protein